MAGETYTKRYGGGFKNRPDVSTPADAQFLNAVETALARLLGEDPAQDEVGVWVPASNRFVFKKITNAQVDPAAAIARSKLDFGAGLVNADIAAGAAIAKSKLAALGIVNADVDAAAAIALSKLAHGGDIDSVLRGDGTYGRKILRKATSKTVTNTVAATDLLNGEITIPAGAVTATGSWRLKLWGVSANASGAAQNENRFQVILGGTTILDTATSGVATSASGGGALPWELEVECMQANATNTAQFSAWYRANHTTSSTTAWLPVVGAGVTMATLNSVGYVFVIGQYQNGHDKDMTVAQSLVVNLIQPVASASYTTILNGALLEIR